MNGINLTTFRNWWSTLCLLVCCGLLSIQTLSAQQPKGWDISLGAPGLEAPTNVSDKGFTATWSNVFYEQYNQDGSPWNSIFFRMIMTREILAKSDGNYNIAKAQVKPNPSGKKESIASGQQTFLNGQLSQTAWTGALAYWTPEGFSIAGSDLEGSGFPEESVNISARLTSPVMNLTNAGGKYTVEFTAKVLKGKGDQVKMQLFGYGEELNYSTTGVPGPQPFTIPNDGQPHKFSFDMEHGTWCHRIVIEMHQFAEIEFSGDLVVKQSLKKGDQAFRSTYYGVLPYKVAKRDRETITGLTYPEIYAVKYSYDFGAKDALDPRSLDLEAAKADGERVAYRMLYANDSPGSGDSRILAKSMYSAPSYFDNVEEENNYLYLGYCNYEAPNYNSVEPSGPTWAGYHGGAIKLTKEMLKEHVGSKVVGIRLASAACRQKNQVNDNKGFFDVKLPCIFLAESVLTVDKKDINNPKVITPWKPIMITSVDKFQDGWNTLFFDRPYEIKADEEFFAGAYAYDEAAKGGILVRSYQSPGVDPNSAWIGTNWSTYTLPEAEFNSRVSKGDGPLLMQLIIEPKTVDPTVQNRGELRGLTAPSFIFTDEELKPTIDLFNTGIKSIAKVKVETDLAGKKQEQTIELTKYLPSSLNREITLEAIAHDGISGKVQLSVKLLEVNGVALATPSVQTVDLEILKRDEAYERTTLVELFTSEKCQYCPQGDTWFEEILNKPENAKIKDKLILVSHHSFFMPDFLVLPYSQGLAPFYGIRSVSGDISLVSPTSPANMFNRMPLPALGDAKGKNGSVYSIIGSQGDLEKVAKAAEINPASVFVEVKPWFKKDEQKLNVLVQGRASARLDRSRPVYLTIMITQDEITPRNQLYSGSPIAGFVHTNVLRYVDEGGFKGTEVQFDEKGDFKIVKDLTIATTDAKSGNLAPNTLLLEGDNKSLEDVMNHVNVIAFLHNYTELPTNDNVEDNDKRLLGNEVLNAAQRRVSFTSFEGVEDITSQAIQVTVQDGSVRVNVPVADLQVYDATGRMVPATELQAGVYVVRLVLMDGSETFAKVVAK